MQSADLAAREEKLFQQRDSQTQQAKDLSQRQKQLAAQEAANRRETQRLQGLRAELEATQADLQSRALAAAARQQQLDDADAGVQLLTEEVLKRIEEVNVSHGRLIRLVTVVTVTSWPGC
jgi:hypothetical protein